MPDTLLKREWGWGRSGAGTAQGKIPADIHSISLPCESPSITRLSTTQLVKRVHFFPAGVKGPKRYSFNIISSSSS